MSRKEKFFWWKVIITVISFIAVILSKSTIDWSNLSNNYIDSALCKEIAYDLSVGVFSAMILVWFIDEINEHIQEKKNRAKEIDEIIRSNRLLQLYIERYKVFFYCVITPMKERDFKNMKFPTDFKLKDMRELHKQTLLAEVFSQELHTPADAGNHYQAAGTVAEKTPERSGTMKGAAYEGYVRP